jgi:hypothetical protein
MPVNSIEALRSRIFKAIDDRKVTAGEAEEIIDLAKDGQAVTHSEQRELRDLLANADLFEDSVRNRLNQFVEIEATPLLRDDHPVNVVDGAGRRDLADPAVAVADQGRAVYEWTSGSLFVDGVSADDVQQGKLDDCYLVAALSAVALQEPKLIEEAIQDNGDGTYTVRFFDVLGGRDPKPVTIVVDGQLPVVEGGLRYARGRDRSELWVPLLEKAYAQWKGGYPELSGGRGASVLKALTGREGYSPSVTPSSDPQALFTQLQEALARKKAVLASTHAKPEDPELYSGTGVYGRHMYSVTGVSEENGTRYIHLRNPWGYGEPEGNGPDDGHFKLDFATFQKLFGQLNIN